MKYQLVRERDSLTLEGNVILWIEWNEDGTFKDRHHGPKIGCSLVLDPGGYNMYTWLTTEVLEFEEEVGLVKFKTKNSNYELTIRE
jgi:hypothetical protein